MSKNQSKRRINTKMREYKVTITETVLHHMWILADDPQDAIDIAEKTYYQAETLDVAFDVDPTEYRNL
jgi:hypothetical protein